MQRQLLLPARSHCRPFRCSPSQHRTPLIVRASQGGRKGGNSDKDKEEAARKALQESLGGKLGFNKPGKKNEEQGEMFVSAPGGGGGDGGNFFTKFFGGGGGDDWGFQDFLYELREIMGTVMVVAGNLLLFLALADVLHRSLDWCAETEVLFLIGAGQQAFERIVSQFFHVIEWFEKNLLGWKWDDGTNIVPKFEVVRNLYNNEMFVVFDQYRYKMTESERQLLGKKYAVKYWERNGGYKGDVDEDEVQRLHDKHEPGEADRREFLAARAAGKLEEYWNATPQRRAIFDKYYVGQA